MHLRNYKNDMHSPSREEYIDYLPDHIRVKHITHKINDSSLNSKKDSKISLDDWNILILNLILFLNYLNIHLK